MENRLVYNRLHVIAWLSWRRCPLGKARNRAVKPTLNSDNPMILTQDFLSCWHFDWNVMVKFFFQVNSVSAFIDGSQIYGANYEEAERLRDRRANLGLLRVLPFPGSSIRSPVLPKAEPESYCRSQDPSRKPCILAGDHRRVNENPGKF